MGKELEAFGLIKRTCELFIQSKSCLIGSDIIEKQINEALKIVQNSLESGNNAGSGEALECLESIEADLTGLPKHVTEYDDGFDNYLEDIWNNIDTIKQALLKQQELPEPFKTGVDIGVIKPKQYLKWEDLEFKDYEQEISVLLNGNKYSVKYTLLPDDDFYMVWIYKENKCIFSLGGKYLEDKQFFNDLRLERVEE